MSYYVKPNYNKHHKKDGNRGHTYCSKNKTHYRDCKSKKRYPDYNSAAKYGKRVGLRAYYCPHCEGYHLSSRKYYEMDYIT